MSLTLQSRQTATKFDVNAAQFEEIIAPKDAVISNSSTMNQESDSDAKSAQKGRKDSYSSGDDTYDDDFESEDNEIPRKSFAKSTARSSPGVKRDLSRNGSHWPQTKSRSVSTPRTNKKVKRKKRFKPYESPRTSSPVSSRVHHDKNWGRPKNRSAHVKTTRLDHTVVDRVLSANHHKVAKLESRLSQLTKELTKEREENRTLRLIQHRQEKKLEQVIGEEAELPQLLVKHTAEVKSLRERVRKLQDTSYHKDERLGEQDKVILKLKDRCKYYKELCEKEELTEKAQLEKNLLKAEDNLKKRDEEISKLQRMLTLKEKAHARNVKEQKEKLRETQRRLQLLEENCNNLQGKLRVKEKQLDYTNIYHQRQIVLKEKGPAPPDSPPKMAALLAPKRNKVKSKPNDKTTSPDTAKETKGYSAGFKTGLSGGDEPSKKPNSVFLTTQSDKESGSDRDNNQTKTLCDNEDGNKSRVTAGFLSITDGNVDSQGAKRDAVPEDEFDDSARRKREEFERHLKEEEERLRKEKDDVERRRKEIQEREECEKAEREAKWREDSARRAREAEEKRLESARRQEETRIEEMRKEERRKEERRKEEMRIEEMRKEEERIAEERKRDEERKEQEKTTVQKEDSFHEDEEARRKKDALLARLKAIDINNASSNVEGPLNFESTKSPMDGNNNSWKPHASKSYEPRKADQNLHDGLPAVPWSNRVSSPNKSVNSDPDGVFGITRQKPTLIGRVDLTKKRESNQLNWSDENKKPDANKPDKLDTVFSFGDYSPSMSDNKKRLDDLFDTGLSRRAGGGRRREGGVGESVFDLTDKQVSEGKHQNNSLGFLSDDLGSKNGEKSGGGQGSPLLPRRRTVQEKGVPIPISSAFDDNLDDIEEFIL